MPGLKREEILAQAKAAPVWVDVPEWKGGVYVREISASARDRFESTMVESAGPERLANVRARFVALVACDEAGQALFAEADVAALGELSAKALDRIFDAGRKLNGMLSDAEDVEKNSASTPAAASA